LSEARTAEGSDQAYKVAQESFVRKHGREPLEELEIDG